MDLLETINAALPGLPPDVREEIIQDIAVLVLEDKISLERLASDIREHLPALKRQYPSLQFQLSLDAPVNNAEGTTLTFGDIVQKSTIQPKRRIRIGRPVTRKVMKARCEKCNQHFYFKIQGKRLSKKESGRAKLLPEIHPKWWTEDDVNIMLSVNPQLVGRLQFPFRIICLQLMML